MKSYIPLEEDKIFVYGRVGSIKPLTLFWTGSGIEFNTDGSELYIDFDTDYDIYEQWVRVEVNGYSMIRTSLPKGRYSLCVYRNMNPANIRNVRVFKEVQPMKADMSGKLQIEAVRSDGKLYELEKKSLKLEFVGDSITSGEGLAGVYGMTEWNSAIFTTDNHYAVTAAKKLKADIRIISQSGWGVCSSWDNDPKRTLPMYYEQVCGFLKGEAQKEAGAQAANDFEKWKPDVIIVNLGSNDGFAFDNKAWTDPEDGRQYQQKRNPDGSFEKESTDRFEKAVYDFLMKLRRNNKDSVIVWAYGMIGTTMEEYILNALNRYKSDSGDQRVIYHRFDDLKTEWMGANNHPGIPSHQAAADSLVELIKSIKTNIN